MHFTKLNINTVKIRSKTKITNPLKANYHMMKILAIILFIFISSIDKIMSQCNFADTLYIDAISSLKKHDYNRADSLFFIYNQTYYNCDSGYYYAAITKNLKYDFYNNAEEARLKGVMIQMNLDYAIKLNPNFHEAYYYLAVVEYNYFVLFRGELNAFVLLDKSLKIKPDYLPALKLQLSTIEAFFKENPYELEIGLEYINNALLISSNKCEILNLKADWYAKNKMIAKACEIQVQLKKMKCPQNKTNYCKDK